MLDSISLKFTEVSKPVVVPSQGVTIFVGPNNSGKSLVLRELETDISSYQRVETKLVEDFEIVWVKEDQVEADILNLTKKSPVGISPDNVHVGRFTAGGDLEGIPFRVRSWLRSLESARKNAGWLLNF